MPLVEPERIREFFRDLDTLMKENPAPCVCATYDWSGEDLTAKHHPDCPNVPDSYSDAIHSLNPLVYIPLDYVAGTPADVSKLIDLQATCDLCGQDMTGSLACPSCWGSDKQPMQAVDLSPKYTVQLSCGTHGLYHTQITNSNWFQMQPCPRCPLPQDKEVTFTLKAR
jgi:hypothetical protein